MKPTKIVDLSLVLSSCMPAWPTQPNFLYEQTRNVARDGATLHVIRQMATHTGTHVDTPLHFVAGGASVDQLPVDVFMGEGVVVDLSDKQPRERSPSRTWRRLPTTSRPARCSCCRRGGISGWALLRSICSSGRS